MKFTEQAKGTSAILFATLLWGMTFAFIKDAVATTSPFNFLFWRFGIASLLLYVFFHKYIELTNTKLIRQGILLGLFLGGTVIFQTIGLHYTAASTASFITGLSVILVTLFVCLIEKKWPTRNVVFAVILATCGVGLITLTNGMAINQGDVWVMLCAICFAIYIILAGKFSKSGKPFTLTLIQMITIFLIAGLIGLITRDITIPRAANVWTSILFCAIFASVIAFTLQLRYQQYVNPNKTAIIFASEPAFATVTAALYLDERITMQFILGALLIFSAILLSEKRIKKKVIPQD